jgi:hypothetical protein
VFGFQKCKANMPLDFEFESHRPDIINISHPLVRTRSNWVEDPSYNLHSIPKELFPNLWQGELGSEPITKLVTPINMSRTPHVTWIQEMAYDKLQWHIIRLPKTSSKAYFDQQVVIKKKCIAKILQNNKSITTPTYPGMMVYSKKNKAERMQFFFCNDDRVVHERHKTEVGKAQKTCSIDLAY